MTDAMWAMLWMLVAAHALCDFSLQTEAMAKGKAPGSVGPVPWYYWLSAHALIHGGAVSIITGIWWLGVIEAAVHWLIDMAKCLGASGIHTDQALHVGCKVAWVLIASGVCQ